MKNINLAYLKKNRKPDFVFFNKIRQNYSFRINVIPKYEHKMVQSLQMPYTSFTYLNQCGCKKVCICFAYVQCNDMEQQPYDGQ